MGVDRNGEAVCSLFSRSFGGLCRSFFWSAGGGWYGKLRFGYSAAIENGLDFTLGRVIAGADERSRTSDLLITNQ